MLLLAVALILWGLWEGFRALGMHFGWQHPFPVDATTMPHIHDMIRALFERPNTQGPLLIVTLLKAAAFTGREAALGFAMGAVGGFALGALLAHFRALQRGLLPYVVASQTVPILAIAPMVVIWLGSIHVTAWISVSVIAAYERINSTAWWSAACRPRSVAITTGKKVRYAAITDTDIHAVT